MGPRICISHEFAGDPAGSEDPTLRTSAPSQAPPALALLTSLLWACSVHCLATPGPYSLEVSGTPPPRMTTKTSPDIIKRPLRGEIAPRENPCSVLVSYDHLYSHRHSCNTCTHTHTHSHRHIYISLPSRMSYLKYGFVTCSFSPNNTLPINSAINSAGSKEKQVSAQMMWEGSFPAHHTLWARKRVLEGGFRSAVAAPTGCRNLQLGGPC